MKKKCKKLKKRRLGKTEEREEIKVNELKKGKEKMNTGKKGSNEDIEGKKKTGKEKKGERKTKREERREKQGQHLKVACETYI